MSAFKAEQTRNGEAGTSASNQGCVKTRTFSHSLDPKRTLALLMEVVRLRGKRRHAPRPGRAHRPVLHLRDRRPLLRRLALAKRRGMSPVQLALGYVRTRPFIGAQIIGATTLAQLDENLAAAQFELDAETRAEIDALLVRYPNPAN